jgi:anhydro-N-acetylmuramic acid kinase
MSRDHPTSIPPSIPTPIPTHPPTHPPTPHRLIAGVMSGTSADGIDVAVCRIPGPPSLFPESPVWGELIGHAAHPYSAETRRHIHQVRELGAVTLEELAKLTRGITLEHARAVTQTLQSLQITASAIDAVSDHGQTLFHAPPLTMQVLDPSLLAYMTGIRVVSDFRRADCAAGGQGAPLVPYADLKLFAHPEMHRATLNIGGISNITLLPAGTDGSDVVAFDTGPGNCLSDHIFRTNAPEGGSPGIDVGGAVALSGKVSERVVRKFLSDGYFSAAGPKSTDGPNMVAAFERAEARKLPVPDALATAAECVGRSIAQALMLGKFRPRQLIVAGGGVHNRAIMSSLQSHLGKTIKILTSEDLGIPTDAREAIAFALLAAATLEGRPGNLPSVTGAARPVVLGSITPR